MRRTPAQPLGAALVKLPAAKRIKVLRLAAYFASGFEKTAENARRAIKLALHLI